MENKGAIMLAAPGSNSGKTTVTIALLSALVKSGKSISAFKSGPDYIDPMFHKRVIGIPSSNLDIYIMGENNCRYLFHKNTVNSQMAVVEGVMGYYDGIANSSKGSSYELAKALNLPVVLVVNIKGMAISACALIKGFQDFREHSNIKGVIINGCSKGMYNYYRELIEKNVDVKVYGYLPFLEDCSIGSRHLGLIRAEEIEHIETLVDKLGEVALETMDIEGLLQLGREFTLPEFTPPKISYLGNVKIAVAKDEAFNFYYEDSLNLLREMGAEIKYFSPLTDSGIPLQCHGLYIGGGYPELYMEKLSENKSMLKSIGEAIENNMPTFAECGGYMYLLEQFEDSKGNLFKLVGAIKGKSNMTKSLKNFGYAKITANETNLLCEKGESIRIHEFHYSQSNREGESFTAEKPLSNRKRDTIVTENNLFAGYPHLHFISNVKFAENFIKKAIEYKRGKYE